MILPGLAAHPRIDPSTDTMEDSLPHKISKLCPPNSVRFKIARPPMPIFRHFTLNILKRDTSKKRGINGKQKNARLSPLHAP